MSLDRGVASRGRILIEGLFLAAAFLAPIEPRLFAAFTVHDLLILFLAAVLFLPQRAFPHLPLKFLVFAYVFLVWALVSTLRAPYPLESLTEVAQFVFIFLVHVPTVVSLARSGTLTRRSVAAIVAGALAVALWALLTHRLQGAGRVITFISKNPNRLGYPTAYLLPFLLHFALSGARRLARWWVIAAVALPCLYLFLWALGASGSRSATLATLVALATYLSARTGASSALRLAVRLTSAAAAAVLVGVLLYSTSLLPPKLQQRIDRTLTFESSLVDDRIRLADAGFRAFSAHPWVGVGLDNFRYVAKQYNPAATDQVPHNMWIQFLAQLGIPGTFAFLGLMVLWFVVLTRAWRSARDQVHRDLLAAFIASMAGILAIYMFIPIMTQRQYWLLYGLGLACAQMPDEAAHGPGGRRLCEAADTPTDTARRSDERSVQRALSASAS